MVLTGRAENHLHGVDDLDDTIARLVAYRDAGADAVYAPGLRDLGQIAAVVEAVGVPVNVLALPGGPTIAELAAVGVRRVSTGGAARGVRVRRPRGGSPRSCSRKERRVRGGGVSRELLRTAFG